jgi:hypothetical protein
MRHLLIGGARDLASAGIATRDSSALVSAHRWSPAHVENPERFIDMLPLVPEDTAHPAATYFDWLKS